MAQKKNIDNTKIRQNDKVRPVIYQLLPRLFSNSCPSPKPWGPLTVNGSGKLNDITETVLTSIKQLGVTHVWYTGVIEHAHDADYTRYGIPKDNPYVIKGRAGSPYAITDYYDIDPDLAVDVEHRITEFEQLVDRTHKLGLKVVIDFVPNHVGRQYRSDARPGDAPADFGADDDTDMFFSPTNDFYYITRQQFAPQSGFGEGTDNPYIEFPAKASGNDCYTAFPSVNDWYDTVKLNYGVDPWNGSKHFAPIPGVWRKMLHILGYWAAKGVDAFRCDMVHMVPVEFWSWALPQIKARFPGIIFIAEIYDVSLYRPYINAGFDYLYDKVTLYDTLRAIVTSHVSAASLTSCWQTVEGIGDNMLTFLENHDEQRYASLQFAGTPATALAPMAVTACMGRGAVMIYMGQELGEPGADAEGFSGNDGRTTIFDYWSVEKLRRWLDMGTCKGKLSAGELALRDMYSHVLNAVNKSSALSEGKFFDLMYVNYDNPSLNPHSEYAFMRASADEAALIVANFGTSECETSVRIPLHAFSTLSLTPGEHTATDLISLRKRRIAMAPDSSVSVKVPPHGAVILVWPLK